MRMLAWMLVLLALQGAPPMRVVDKGDQSNVDEARQVAVRTAPIGTPFGADTRLIATNRASISGATWSSA